MSKLLPLAGYVVVKREEKESTTASGIILTEDTKEKPQRGQVMAVGAGKEGREPQVKEGQTVLFKKYGPTEVEMDGEEMLLLEEDDILAIVQ